MSTEVQEHEVVVTTHEENPIETGVIRCNGKLRLQIEGGEHSGKTLEISISLLSLIISDALAQFPENKMTDDEAAKAIEDYHPGKTYYRRTADFLIDLNARLEKVIGFCDIDIADELWTRFEFYREQAKKNSPAQPSSPSTTAPAS